MKENNDDLLADRFLTNHKELAVALIEKLTTDDIARFIESISPEQSRTILTQLTPYRAGKVLESVPVEKAVRIFKLLPINISETILRIINTPVRKQILAGLPLELGKYLKGSLSFKSNEVGAHLEPDVFTLSDTDSVEKALSEMKATQVPKKPIVFVLDEGNRLMGYLEVSDLVSNEPSKKIRSILRKISKPVIANMLVKDVLENWNDLFVELPVVKGDGLFLGVVSRAELSKLQVAKEGSHKLEVKAGNALGELFLIGLSSLLTSSEQNIKP